jgi:hypothetical protein
MGSYIDFQIKVTGPANSLIKLKELLIKVDNENKTYDIEYKELMQHKKGVLSREYIDQNDFDQSKLEEYYILDEFVNDFKFEYYNNYTFYDWFGNGRTADLGIWESDCWQKFTEYDNQLFFNGIANHTPPLIHIIAASRLFPELFFRISFFVVTDELHPYGSIEGQNGFFAESRLNYYYIDSINQKRVYLDRNGNWIYYDNHNKLDEYQSISRMVENLFDKTARYKHNPVDENQKLVPFQPNFVLNKLDERVTLESSN